MEVCPHYRAARAKSGMRREIDFFCFLSLVFSLEKSKKHELVFESRFGQKING